jgi:hypothetical protein
VHVESLSIEHGTDGSSRARFLVQSPWWTPDLDQVVQMFDEDDSDRLIFSGRIDDVTTEYAAPGLLLYNVSSLSDGAILDQRVVVRWLNPIVTGSLRASVEGLVNDYLADTALTFTPAETDDLPLGELLLPGVTLREAFDRIAKAAGVRWFITSSGKIRFTKTAANFEAAPVSPLTGQQILVGSRRRKSVRKSANRVWVKSSSFGSETKWSDTRYGDGSNRNFQTTYQITREPTITINGNPAGVIESGDISGPIPGWVDFIWMQYFAAVLHNPDKLALTASDEIVISYSVPLPFMAYAEESPLGFLRETVVERNELASLDALQQAAEEELAKLQAGAEILDLVVAQGHWSPGMIVTVNWSELSISGQFVVESASARLVGNNRMAYELSLGKLAPQKMFASVDPAKYFSDLLDDASGGGTVGGKGAGDAKEVLTFVLAGTVEGITNPGLTAGAKQAVRVASVGGKIRDVRLYFKSAPGSTIEIDVLKNGSSIFGSPKLQLSGGQNGPVVRDGNWAAASIEVTVGDIFTISVVTGNSAAKDGSLVITLV